MRLIKLRIHNLASLKGEHEVNFAEIQRVSTLFAITGETGAGKSTLLNAIGLALYGDLYRPQLNQVDVVSLGEKEASIQLLFSLKNSYYIADWKIRVRKANGEPLKQISPQRYIYKVPTPDLDSEKTIIEEKAETLLQLNFDQFCKCIILNQGEFARFLMSSFTERKEILERLYPGEMLENLSKIVRAELDEFQQQKQKLEIEREAISSNHLHSPEDLKLELAKIELKHKAADTEQNEQEKVGREITSLKTYLIRFQETKAKKDKLFEDLKIITQNINEHNFKIEKSLVEFEEVKKDRETQGPKLQLLLQKEERLEVLRMSLIELTKKQASLQYEEKQLHQKKTDVADQSHELSLEIKTQTDLLKFPKLESNTFLSWMNELQGYLTTEQIIHNEKSSLHLQMKDIEEIGKKKSEEKKEIEQHLKEKLQNLQHATNLKDPESFEIWKQTKTKEFEIGQKKNIEHKLLSEIIESSQKNVKAFTARMSDVKGTIHNLKLELAPLELLSETIDLARAVGQCFTHDMGECPVCHSSLTNEKLTKIKLEISEKLKLFDAAKLKLLKEQLDNALVQEHTLSAQIEDETKKLNNSHDLFLSLNREINELGDLEKGKALLQSGQALFEEIKRLKRESELKEKEIEERRKDYQKLKNDDLKRQQKETEQEKIKHTLLATIGESILPDINLVKEEKQIREMILGLQQKLAHLKQETDFVMQMIAKNKTELEHISLEVTSKSKDSLGLDEELSHALKGESARTLWKKLEERYKLVDERHRALESEMRVIQLSQKDIQSRLYTFDEQIRDLETAFIQHIHEIVGIANESKLRSGNYQALWDNLAHLKIELTDPVEILIPMEEILTRNIIFLKEENKTHIGRLGEIQQILQEAERRKDRVEFIQKQLDDISAKFNRAERLFDVLGKDDLRNFALSMVEENLIRQTNLELEKLCSGRYQILHQTRKMKLSPEFYILDKYREGLVRKVSTLSGGETFMVSLCMALALAEMTRGQAEIDSLFIDEGFGTLDQDSLEEVLDMLQHIQARGLQIGLISHVKNLTSRLAVNLHLTKKSDGNSTIGLVYN